MKNLAILLFTVVYTTSYAQSANNEVISTKEHRIIMQLVSGDTLVHKNLIKQFNNLLAAAPNAKIAVVCHGPGLNFLQKSTSKVAPAIEKLSGKIEFIACENTMRERNIPKDDILKEASFVKAGILEVVQRQENGWSYIKAGF